MHARYYQIFLSLALSTAMIDRGAAEEFKYYVWIDDQGIVHAAEEAPKGRDYEVRIIEDINANVVPAEDFRIGDTGQAQTDGTGSDQNEAPAGQGASTNQ